MSLRGAHLLFATKQSLVKIAITINQQARVRAKFYR
jgi:hypothetical protein